MPASSNIRVVLFHLYKCPPCERFLESGEWEKLKELVKQDKELKDVTFVQYQVVHGKDESEGNRKAEEEQVGAFPTIRIYKNGEKLDYENSNGMKAANIFSFIKGGKSGETDDEIKVDSDSENGYKQCGGGHNKEEYYKMKYYKYKAKYIQIKAEYS